MSTLRLRAFAWLMIALCSSAAAAAEGNSEPTSQNNERLRQGLRQIPAADSNQDGVLTMSEARAFLAQRARSQSPRKSGGKTKTGKAREGAAVPPTFADVKYGPHTRNVLDFWKSEQDGPRPLVVFIHGGGFRAGDKSKVRGDKIIQQCLDAGISFAAINYRFRPETPIPDILRDCARTIQFLRSQSVAWNIDKNRVAAYGGSAGAGTSLWLAFHDDLADPTNTDPVLRESSRLTCAGAQSCQFSYDIVKWKDLFGDAAVEYQVDGDLPAFYGLQTEQELLGPIGQRLRTDCDMVGMITRDDPPVFLSTNQPGGEVKDRGHLLHHPRHAQAIQQRCAAVGIEAIASLPGLDIHPPAGKPQELFEFLCQHLTR
jgi:acetyl esterase/lipase